jgi:glycine dehydrogenase subunit 2
MDAMTFQPAAGAHGEFTGLLMIKAYHCATGGRRPATRSSFPTPPTAPTPPPRVMAGFDVVNIPSGSRRLRGSGRAARQRWASDTAGLMLTNPNTLGMFDNNILEITRIVHAAGGLCYYDGANLNAVVGVVRPGDMGFDVSI